MMDFNNELKKLAQKIITLETIEIDDIPNIDLYMDQVTTFMETKLFSYKRDKEDKILTKTMINNYAKAKLLPAPVRKKYNKNHIMILILIYHLKNILSIGDINSLLTPINNQLAVSSKSDMLENIYKNFVTIQKNINGFQIGDAITVNALFQDLALDKTMKNYDIIENIISVLILAVYSGTEKRLAEKIIDLRINNK